MNHNLRELEHAMRRAGRDAEKAATSQAVIDALVAVNPELSVIVDSPDPQAAIAQALQDDRGKPNK